MLGWGTNLAQHSIGDWFKATPHQGPVREVHQRRTDGSSFPAEIAANSQPPGKIVDLRRYKEGF